MNRLSSITENQRCVTYIENYLKFMKMRFYWFYALLSGIWTADLTVTWQRRILCYLIYLPAPFTGEERSLINELRLEDIGAERRATILEQTFEARQRWVVNCYPQFSELVSKFPPLKDLGVQVNCCLHGLPLVCCRAYFNSYLFFTFLPLFLGVVIITTFVID